MYLLVIPRGRAESWYLFPQRDIDPSGFFKLGPSVFYRLKAATAARPSHHDCVRDEYTYQSPGLIIDTVLWGRRGAVKPR